MPPLPQFSNCRGPRLALISVPSRKILSVADVFVAKTVYILIMETLQKKNLYMQDLDQYNPLCYLNNIYSFSKGVRSRAIRYFGNSRAVYLRVELVALLFVSHAWVKVKSLCL